MKNRAQNLPFTSRCFNPTHMNADDVRQVAHEISYIFPHAFWSSNRATWPADRIMARLTSVSLITVVYRAHEPIGYGLFETALHRTSPVLFISSCGVDAAYQRKGIATSIIAAALQKSRSHLIAFRTQNPAAVKSILKFNPRIVTPITAEYDSATREILRSLRDQIHELQETTVDMTTGLCKKVYREGKLGDYEINVKDPVILFIENRFQELGLRRDEGDAVVVIARDIWR